MFKLLMAALFKEEQLLRACAPTKASAALDELTCSDSTKAADIAKALWHIEQILAQGVNATIAPKILKDFIIRKGMSAYRKEVDRLTQESGISAGHEYILGALAENVKIARQHLDDVGGGLF